jgi:hypothetical protein
MAWGGAIKKDMADFYEYIRLHSYPHMLPPDARIWDAFVYLHSTAFTNVQYDVHVGEGMPRQQHWDDSIYRMAKIITQRRIDVIGWKNQIPWIIEVKQSPGVSAVGQLVSYKTLYLREYPQHISVKLYLICDRLDQDIAFVLRQNNIFFTVVPISETQSDPEFFKLPSLLL